MDQSLSPSLALSSSDSRQVSSPNPSRRPQQIRCPRCRKLAKRREGECLPPPQLSNNDGFPGSSPIQPSDTEEAIVGRKTNKEDQGQIQFVPMEAMNMMDLRQFLWMQHGEAAGSKTMEMPGMGVRRLAAKSEWEQDEDGEKAPTGPLGENKREHRLRVLPVEGMPLEMVADGRGGRATCVVGAIVLHTAFSISSLN
ncbi:hypothetical protein EJB05_24012, partial [Eragrostis curvula]